MGISTKAHQPIAKISWIKPMNLREKEKKQEENYANYVTRERRRKGGIHFIHITHETTS